MSSAFTRLIMKFYVVIYRTDTLTTDKANQLSTPGSWDFSAFPSWDLDVVIDGGAPQTITIDSTLFDNPAEATAPEVVDQINAEILNGFAIEDADGAIVLATNTLGDGGSVVIGGDAGGVLAFPTTEAAGGAYDSVWGAPRPTADGTQTGTDSRRELAPITQLCQLDRDDWGSRTMTAGGESQKADTVIVLRKDHLATAGLMGSDGLPLLHVGDRVARILQRDGNIAQEFDDPPGMWINKIEPAGYGLTFFGNAEIDLFYLHCSKDRETEKA
jgi:hypothetical protein